MINLFKKKQEEIKEEFAIGEFDFKIDSDNSTVEIDGNKIINLTIKADENVFDNLCENDDFEFGYGLYPPEFYARGIDFGKKNQIVINERNQSDYETAQRAGVDFIHANYGYGQVKCEVSVNQIEQILSL